MNLLKHYNEYWENVTCREDLKPHSRLVYLALLQVNNKASYKNQWRKKFSVDYQRILDMTGFANRKTYYEAIDELVRLGFINYEKSKNKFVSAIIEILPVQNADKLMVEQMDMQMVEQADNSVSGKRTGKRASQENINKQVNHNPLNHNPQTRDAISFNDEYFNEVKIFFKEYSDFPDWDIEQVSKDFVEKWPDRSVWKPNQMEEKILVWIDKHVTPANPEQKSKLKNGNQDRRNNQGNNSVTEPTGSTYSASDIRL